jgi:hypothetical protein
MLATTQEKIRFIVAYTNTLNGAKPLRFIAKDDVLEVLSTTEADLRRVIESENMTIPEMADYINYHYILLFFYAAKYDEFGIEGYEEKITLIDDLIKCLRSKRK